MLANKDKHLSQTYDEYLCGGQYESTLHTNDAEQTSSLSDSVNTKIAFKLSKGDLKECHRGSVDH